MQSKYEIFKKYFFLFIYKLVKKDLFYYFFLYKKNNYIC